VVASIMDRSIVWRTTKWQGGYGGTSDQAPTSGRARSSRGPARVAARRRSEEDGV
jgi:hypothetical protein